MIPVGDKLNLLSIFISLLFFINWSLGNTHLWVRQQKKTNKNRKKKKKEKIIKKQTKKIKKKLKIKKLKKNKKL